MFSPRLAPRTLHAATDNFASASDDRSLRPPRPGRPGVGGRGSEMQRAKRRKAPIAPYRGTARCTPNARGRVQIPAASLFCVCFFFFIIFYPFPRPLPTCSRSPFRATAHLSPAAGVPGVSRDAFQQRGSGPVASFQFSASDSATAVITQCSIRKGGQKARI